MKIVEHFILKISDHFCSYCCSDGRGMRDTKTVPFKIFRSYSECAMLYFIYRARCAFVFIPISVVFIGNRTSLEMNSVYLGSSCAATVSLVYYVHHSENSFFFNGKIY